jgi:hypothetical protein
MSSAFRLRSRPLLERLETRFALSGNLPANSIGSATGNVSQSGGTSEVSVTVAPKNLTAGKSSTLFGVFVQPGSGSALAPRIVRVEQSNGRLVPLKLARPFVAGRGGDRAAAFAKVNRPGPLTVVVAGQKHTTGSFEADVTLAGDVNGDGTVNLADLTAFAPTYETAPGNREYEASADFNQNGIINLDDAKALMQNMPPLEPNGPLTVGMALLPADQAQYRTPTNLGGATSLQDVTIVGRTIPGSIVLEDSSSGFFNFDGTALATDARGFFSTNVKLTQGVNTYEFLVLDPFGRQVIRSFPIFWLPFAAPGSKLR